MSQRTALEQDTIDFARSVDEIFEKQLKLQSELLELLHQVLARLKGAYSGEELELKQFGVNNQALCNLNTKDLKKTSPNSDLGIS